jgi:hypothetical protein
MRKFRAQWVKVSGKWFIDCPSAPCYDVIFAKRGETTPHDRVMAHIFTRHPEWLKGE